MTTPPRSNADPDTAAEAAAAPPRAVFAATPSTILAGARVTPNEPAEPTTPVRAPRQRSRTTRPQRSGGSGTVMGLPKGPAAVVAVVTLAVAVAVVLAVVVTGLSSRSGGQASAATTASVEKVATAGTQAALSYNYQHLAADFAAAEKFMTPGFTTNYTKTKRTVQPLAVKYHAVSAATVMAAGVGSISSSHATLLLFVDQTVKNSQLSAPRLDRSRVEVTLVKSGGRWLIDDLKGI